jgi:hypothetical protein
LRVKGNWRWEVVVLCGWGGHDGGGCGSEGSCSWWLVLGSVFFFFWLKSFLLLVVVVVMGRTGGRKRHLLLVMGNKLELLVWKVVVVCGGLVVWVWLAAKFRYNGSKVFCVCILGESVWARECFFRNGLPPLSYVR